MLSRKKIWQKTRTTRCSSSSSRGGGVDHDHCDGDGTPRSSPRSPTSATPSSHWVLESEAASAGSDYNSDDSESEYSTSHSSKTHPQNGLNFTSLFTNLPVYNTRPSLKGLQTDGVIIDMSELPPPSERRRQYNNNNNSRNSKSSTSNNSNNSKRVTFCLAVKVILIPTRDEFRRLGLFDELFWTHADFVQFKQEAFNELQNFMLTNEYKVKKKAMKRLGVLKNFVDSDDILKYDSLNSQRRRALLFPPTSSKLPKQSSSSSSSNRYLKQKGSLDNFFKDLNDVNDDEFIVDDESLRTLSHDYNGSNIDNHNSNLSNDGMIRVSSSNQLKEASVILYQPNEYFETLADYKEEDEEDVEGEGVSRKSVKSVCKTNIPSSTADNIFSNNSSNNNSSSSSKANQSEPTSSSAAVVVGDVLSPSSTCEGGECAAEFGLDQHVWHSVEQVDSLTIGDALPTTAANMNIADAIDYDSSISNYSSYCNSSNTDEFVANNPPVALSNGK